MVKKRWYDTDPTISMAVSLLQSASRNDQIKTVNHIYALLEASDAFNKYNISSPMSLSFIFPFVKRKRLDEGSWRLLEVMKHLPQEMQLEVSLKLIQYIYELQFEVDDFEEELESRAL